MISKDTRAHLSEISRFGCRKSRWTLMRAPAPSMAAVQLARLAFHDYGQRYFRPYSPSLILPDESPAWVADQLMRSGDRSAWQTATRI